MFEFSLEKRGGEWCCGMVERWLVMERRVSDSLSGVVNAQDETAIHLVRLNRQSRLDLLRTAFVEFSFPPESNVFMQYLL